MFRKLRERIAEEANKLPVNQINFGNNSPKSADANQSLDNVQDHIIPSDSPSVIVPQPSSQQFSIAEDEDGSMSEPNTPKKQEDSNSVNNVGGSSYYVPQTDIESELEEPPTLNLDGISKEQLLVSIQRLKARLSKYKNKYSEVIRAYKSISEEKKKIECALTDNQDKSLRRIAELREQCQLEQKAKAHLEENLRLNIEEKDSRISVLEMQINLLKEGQCETISQSSNSTETLSQAENDLQYKDKEKDVVEQLNALRKEYDEFQDKESKLCSGYDKEIENLKKQLSALKQQEENNIMSMAETKKNMHEELEAREKQLNKLKDELRQIQKALEKERISSKNLAKQHEDKQQELRNQLNSMEEEKENLLRDFARGKAEAIMLIQQENVKNISSLEEEWKSRVQNVKADLTEKADELNEMSEKLSTAESEMTDLKKLVDELQTENQRLSESADDYKNVLYNTNPCNEEVVMPEAAYQTGDVRSENTEEQNLEMVELHKKLDRLKKENKALKSKVKLKEENTVLNNQLDESLLVAAANQKQTSELLEKTKKYGEELQEELSFNLKKHIEKEDELHCVIRCLEMEIESIKLTKLELAEEVEAKCLSNNQIQSENHQLKEELDSLRSVKSEKEHLNKRIQTLELSEAKLNAIIGALQEEVKSLKNKCNCADCACGKVSALKSENERLTAQNSQCLNCETLRKDAVRLTEEFDNKLQAKDEELQKQLKLVANEVSKQMHVSDANCDETVSEIIEKTYIHEEQLEKEHRLEIAALRQDIFEKDCALEEMHEHYEGIIKEKDSKLQTYSESLKSLQNASSKDGDAEPMDHCEPSDWDDTWVIPEENCDNLSPAPENKAECEEHLQQIESMQKELAKCNSELKDLRILLRLSPPPSLHSNNFNSSTQLPEPTEYEYLKNIMFEYMMGKETVTLVKVIAAVLRFTDEQTRLIIEREKAKQPAR